MEKKSNGLSVAALVIGIIAMVGSFIPGINYITPLLGILAIIFGAVGLNKSKKTQTGHGLAVAGLVLGIISAFFAVIVVVLLFGLLAAIL